MEFLEDLVRALNGLEEGQAVCISGKLVVRKIPNKDVEDDKPYRLFEYKSIFDVKKTGERSYEISDVKGEFSISLTSSRGWLSLNGSDFMYAIAQSMQCAKPVYCQKLIDEKKPEQVMLYPA